MVVDTLDQVWKFRTWPFFCVIYTVCTLQEKLLHFLSLPSCIMGMVIINAQGGGSKPFALKILASVPNFYDTVEKKRGS